MYYKFYLLFKTIFTLGWGSIGELEKGMRGAPCRRCRPPSYFGAFELSSSMKHNEPISLGIVCLSVIIQT